MSHPLTKMHRHIESSISHLIHTFPNWPLDEQTLEPPDTKDKSHFPTWIRWRPVQSLRRRRRQNRRRNDGDSDFTPDRWGYDTVDEDTEVADEEGRIEVTVSVAVYVRAVMRVICCDTLLRKLIEWIMDNFTPDNIMAGCQSLTNSKTLCVTLQPGHFIQETLSFMYRSTIAARPFLTKTSCKKDRKAQIELDFPCPGTRVSLSDLRVFLHANTLRLKLVSSGAYTHVDFSPRLRFTSTDGKRKVAQVLRALQGRKEKRDNTVLDVLDWLDSDAILSSCDSLSTNGDDDRDDHEQVMKLDKGTLSEVVTLQWAELWMAHCQRTLQIFSQFVDDPEVFGLSLIPKFTGRGGQRDADSVVPIYRVRLTGGSVSRLEKDEGVQETLSVGFVHESQSKKDILEHLADARRMFEPLMDPLRSTKKDLHALSAASIILPLLSVKDPAAPVSWPTAESGQNDQRNRNRKRPDCNIGVTLQYVHARLCGILNPLPLRNKKDDLLLKNVGTSGIWRDPGVLSLCFLLCRRPAIDGDKLDTSALVQWITCLASSISRTVPFVRVQYSAKEEERGEDGRQKVQSQLVAGRVGLLQVCRSVLRDTLQGLLGVTVVQGM